MRIYTVAWKTEIVSVQVFFLKAREDWLEQAKEGAQTANPTLVSRGPSHSCQSLPPGQKSRRNGIVLLDPSSAPHHPCPRERVDSLRVTFQKEIKKRNHRAL